MNTTEFKAHGYYATSAFGGYEIQINDAGDAARLRYVYFDTFSNYGTDTTPFHWQEIKYTAKGRAYVMHNDRRFYLDNFLRYGDR